MWPFIKKTPLRLQINPIECGAVALGIVLEYYGKKVPSHVLNELLQVSRNGSNALSLVQAAKHFGFTCRAKRGLVEDLKGQELAILFFDSCHFVVFEGVYGGRFYINDPASGRYALKRDELRRRFGGIFITLVMPKAKAFRSYFTIKDPCSTIAMLVYGLSWGLIFAFFALALGAQSALSPSLGLGMSIAALLFFLLVFTLVLSLRVIALMLERAEQQSADLIAALKQVRSSFFLTRPFVRFRDAFTMSSVPSIDRRLYAAPLLGIAIVLLVILSVIAWPFALMVFMAALMATLLQLIKSDAPKAANLQLLKMSFEQSWSNYPAIEAMGQNAFLLKRQMDQEQKLLQQDYSIDAMRAQSFANALPLVAFIALLILTNNAQRYGLAFEELVAALLVSLGIFYCSYRIAALHKTSASQDDSASFIAEIKSEALMKEKRADDQLSDNAVIAVNDASFRYVGEDALLLTSVNLQIYPHRCYGVLGPPQAGTSTLLKLLAQKMPWSEGIMAFRSKRFAIIDEEAELFHGSLWDNVTLFDPHINEQQVVKALYQASIEELFLKRPQGLLTSIEAQGKNISVGQKKRLLLARALVHGADLIILDDFFDTLDEALAAQLLKTFKEIKVTLIFSSWRSNELAATDQVIMLGQGTVVAMGTHKELLDNRAYKALIGLE